MAFGWGVLRGCQSEKETREDMLGSPVTIASDSWLTMGVLGGHRVSWDSFFFLSFFFLVGFTDRNGG